MIVAKFLGALIISLFIHELGHYFAALMYGVKAKEFSICTGPKLVQTRVNGTDFILKLFPTGGYNEWPEDIQSKINLVQGIIINLSGVFINYIAAIIFWCIAFNENLFFMVNKINFYIIPYISSEMVKLDLNHIYMLLRGLSDSLPVNETYSFLILLAVSNFALFLINLIPIPSLDGGHAIESVVEIILSRIDISQDTTKKIKGSVYFTFYFILIWTNFINKTLSGYRLIVIFLLSVAILILLFILVKTIKATSIYKKFVKY